VDCADFCCFKVGYAQCLANATGDLKIGFCLMGFV